MRDGRDATTCPRDGRSLLPRSTIKQNARAINAKVYDAKLLCIRWRMDPGFGGIAWPLNTSDPNLFRSNTGNVKHFAPEDANPGEILLDWGRFGWCPWIRLPKKSRGASRASPLDAIGSAQSCAVITNATHRDARLTNFYCSYSRKMDGSD